MAEQVPAVCDVLDVIERRNWTRLRRLLHPDIHWTTAVEPSTGQQLAVGVVAVRLERALAALTDLNSCLEALEPTGHERLEA